MASVSQGAHVCVRIELRIASPGRIAGHGADRAPSHPLPPSVLGTTRPQVGSLSMP